MYGCVHMHVCISVSMWRLKVDVRTCPQLLSHLTDFASVKPNLLALANLGI